MNASRIDRQIAELLDDPLTSLLIDADKVDRRDLANALRKIEPRAVVPSASKCGALSQGRLSRALASAALASGPWRQVALASVCGTRGL